MYIWSLAKDGNTPTLITTIYALVGTKIVHLFAEASDGHATFMTFLRLDASFVMAPHALHLRHSAMLIRPRF